MKLDISEQSLPVYEALASNVRIQIIHLLSGRPMNVRELAEALGLSSAIMTMHVKKLERAGIISCAMVPSKGGAAQKMCSLQVDSIEILFPDKLAGRREFHKTEVSIGHFTDFDIVPTCGICTPDKVIGMFDDPRYFLAPDRVHAKILWFGQGFIEYKLPNYLMNSELPEELEISMEISSEAPGTNNEWPSDITFYLNNVRLGTWTSPGDFGSNPGKLNPSWWFSDINQYGLLKRLMVTKEGTYMDGAKLSDVTIDRLDVRQKQWTFRLAVERDAEHVGGLTLFGSAFGNYSQDIVFKLYYSKLPQPGHDK
ncbi:ArsR family transcriptional regulator [Paenibacillus chartarius]|uniref:ArsR family transcriptional regulator n=1 Tax=Paenibacillus chartarius TaxID=747481 RepID=A0ABV6DLY4_9BACL